MLPLSVLSIGNWTRFLTPGVGLITPDLGAALSTTEQKLYFYIVHMNETFRISVPVTSNVMEGLSALQGNSDALAIAFELSPDSVEFGCWVENRMEGMYEYDAFGRATGLGGYGGMGGGGWKEVKDFTGGEAVRGGRCELTGTVEVSLCAAHWALTSKKNI